MRSLAQPLAAPPPYGCGIPLAGADGRPISFSERQKKKQGKEKERQRGTVDPPLDSPQCVPGWRSKATAPARAWQHTHVRLALPTDVFRLKRQDGPATSKGRIGRERLCVQTIIGAASPPPLDRLSVVRSARSEDVRDEDRAFMTERGEDERIGGVQRGGPPPLAFFFFSPFLFSHGRKRKGAPAEQAARPARTQHPRSVGRTNITGKAHPHP